MTKCYYCKTPITHDGIGWVDETDGDCCWGDDGANEGKPHKDQPMAKHYTIEIRVAFDEAHDVPSPHELEDAVQRQVGGGMLTRT